MEYLIFIGTIFLILFVFVGAIDGIYFHLWKYRLYAHSESLYEHKLHTIRVFLFAAIVFLLFYKNFGGVLLWIGVLLILIDLVVEMLDVIYENRSRAKLGGLSTQEYATHIVVTTLRIAAITLVLAAKPFSAWNPYSSLLLESGYSAWVSIIALIIVMGYLLVGVLHIWLMRSKYLLEKDTLQ
jgi:hypothetical protein